MIYSSYFTLGMRVNVVRMSDALNRMEHWIDHKELGHDIAVVNAYDALSCKKDNRVKEAVNNSSLSVPDGISLVLIARLYGFELKERVYGPDLMLEFLNISENKGYSHFFYGSTPETLRNLKATLKAKFPLLKIAGTYAPPFGEVSREEDEKIIRLINESQADVVWVGLGCPKQQLWMHDHKNRLNVPVMVGVGAAFDFLAGVKPQAPRWLRDHGFEWLFRLGTEPRRLWKRYLLGGPTFLYHVVPELLSNRFAKGKHGPHA